MKIRASSILRVLAAGLCVVAVCYGFSWHYLTFALSGALDVPQLLDIRVTVPTGGQIELQGRGNTGWKSYGVFWDATYRAPNGKPPEPIGKWLGRYGEPTVFVSGDLIVLIPDESWVFVRTKSGVWRKFEIWAPYNWQQGAIQVDNLRELLAQSGFEGQTPIVNSELRYFSPASREAIVDLRDSAYSRGRLFFRLSEDGERMDLVRAETRTVAGSSPAK